MLYRFATQSFTCASLKPVAVAAQETALERCDMQRTKLPLPVLANERQSALLNPPDLQSVRARENSSALAWQLVALLVVAMQSTSAMLTSFASAWQSTAL
jgi:hypothetical protein